jgi:hypothetical protein
MSMFKQNKHEHEWVETQNQFFPATHTLKSWKGHGMDYDTQRLVYGYTRVTHCCKTCPEVNINDHIGRVNTLSADG